MDIFEKWSFQFIIRQTYYWFIWNIFWMKPISAMFVAIKFFTTKMYQEKWNWSEFYKFIKNTSFSHEKYSKFQSFFRMLYQALTVVSQIAKNQAQHVAIEIGMDLFKDNFIWVHFQRWFICHRKVCMKNVCQSTSNSFRAWNPFCSLLVGIGNNISIFRIEIRLCDLIFRCGHHDLYKFISWRRD